MSPSIRRDRIPASVLEVAATLESHGERAFVVGGCLRDLLLGRDPGDWDLATTALPEKVQRIFRRTIPTGLAHGTVTVLWKGSAFEVTTLRGEGAYSDGRHPDSVFFVDDIVRDLERRDFTVNAIAYEASADRLTDPWGGMADLEARCIRAVREPVLRFREDGLRVLRAARFCATLGFTLDPATEEAIPKALDVLAKVSRERVRDEWMKAMAARSPSVAFAIMRRTGILGVVAPALAQTDEAAFADALRVVDAATDKLVRHAALLSAIGEGPEAARAADALLGQLRYSNDERKSVGLLLEVVAPPRTELDRTATRRLLRRVGRAHLERFLAFVEAKAGADLRDDSERWRDSVEQELAGSMVFEAKELRLRGDEIAPLVGGPGPAIKRAQESLLVWVDEDPGRNAPDALRDHLRTTFAESPT